MPDSIPETEHPPQSRLAGRALLRDQLEALHETSANVTLLSLLPAVQVAWADGVIQDKERRAILALAEREGLARDESAMARLVEWLDRPPADAAVRDMLGELRAAAGQSAASDTDLVEKMVGWARAVARADGGFLGLGAVGTEEQRALEWLETALDPEHGASATGVPSRRVRAPGGARSSGLAIMRDLLVERMAATDEHLDLVPKDVDSMWPRPCPLHGDRMPAAVFGVPEDDYDAFMSKIVSRYVRTLTLGVRGALDVARELVSLGNDDEFARTIFETPFARFLTPELDPVDEESFARLLPRARASGTPYKLDFSHLGNVTPAEGIHLAPSVSLFIVDGDALTPVAISLGGQTFEPTDGPSWDLARAFVLQGCSISLVAGIHSSLHFPMDSVIAVTREVLDPGHPIARLIEAHAYLQLPLDYGVRWNPRSVAWNSQREIYSPFPMGWAGVFRGFSDYHAGIDGNSAFPGYRYPMAPPSFPGPYCTFLRTYYDVVLSFCRDVAAHVGESDPRVAAWAAALHVLLPGFPSVEACRDRETLARALAGFVHGVSIWHSVEHHVYAQLPVRRVPQRLRVAPPVGGDRPPPRDEWTRPTDAFRQEMARQMFYEAHTVRGLMEVEYGFAEPELQAAATRFFEALRACDRAQPRHYMDLDRIACSIQF